MARILAVGIATLDIINLVSEYPEEDEKIRILEQQIRCGGNAANTLTVLSQLGHQCSWAGVLADGPEAQVIRSTLARHAIDMSAVELRPKGKTPTSYITLSQRTASRTIQHYRDLPEYALAHFRAIDLAGFDWLHFEGRDIPATRLMLERAGSLYPELPLSVEIEKPRTGIEQLFPLADVLIFSHAYAKHHNYKQAEILFEDVRKINPAARLVCAWGDKGAYALDDKNQSLHAPAFPPARLVDTLAAGDVFNAGLINGLVKKQRLDLTLIEASRLAGRKCGQQGIENLV